MVVVGEVAKKVRRLAQWGIEDPRLPAHNSLHQYFRNHEQIVGNGETNLSVIMKLKDGGRFAAGLPKLCLTIMLLAVFSTVLNVISHTEMQRELNDYDAQLDAPPYFNASNYRKQRKEKQNRIESVPKDIDIEPRLGEDLESPDPSAQRTVHPRVACLRFKAGTQRIIRGCAETVDDFDFDPKMLAIPLGDQSKGYTKDGIPDELAINNTYVETDECKYPESQFAEKARTSLEDNVWSPRPICNDIHSIGFDWELFETHNTNSTRPPAKYLTMGGAKCIWQITSRNDDNHEETYIFKSNKMSRHIKRHYFQQTAIDGLISGQLGNPRLQSAIEGEIAVSDNWNHILPMYGYCGLANIVPFANGGNLREYILRKFKDKERKIDPVLSLQLALQAARGLHQVHMYINGSASFIHADMNPSQFLVFNEEDEVPLLQINDFNQGRFLLHNSKGDVCPYTTCIKNLRGNRCESAAQILCLIISHTRKIDHSPERYIYCAKVNERIDTYSFSGVMYFILTSGLDPHHETRNYFPIIKRAKKPSFPANIDYDHPANEAILHIIDRLVILEMNKRPDSLQLVQMLEKKLKNVQSKLTKYRR